MGLGKVDVGFLQRTAMALATELHDHRVLIGEESMLMQAILNELGVRTPYPPIADVG